MGHPEHPDNFYNLSYCVSLRLRGGRANGPESAGEGPNMPQRREKEATLTDMIIGSSDSGAESEDEITTADAQSLRTLVRRHAFTPEERRQFWAEWHNDTQWANVTLLPIIHGEEEPEEVQWEQERQHGDLNHYRRTFVPTPKYLAWKATQHQRAAELEFARQQAIQSADDISMTSSYTSESEPNWYYANTDEGERLLMWRAAYGGGSRGGKAYEPMRSAEGLLYDNDIDPGDLEAPLPQVKHTWGGEDVQHIVVLSFTRFTGTKKQKKYAY